MGVTDEDPSRPLVTASMTNKKKGKHPAIRRKRGPRSRINLRRRAMRSDFPPGSDAEVKVRGAAWILGISEHKVRRLSNDEVLPMKRRTADGHRLFSVDMMFLWRGRLEASEALPSGVAGGGAHSVSSSSSSSAAAAGGTLANRDSMPHRRSGLRRTGKEGRVMHPPPRSMRQVGFRSALLRSHLPSRAALGERYAIIDIHPLAIDPDLEHVVVLFSHRVEGSDGIRQLGDLSLTPVGVARGSKSPDLEG